MIIVNIFFNFLINIVINLFLAIFKGILKLLSETGLILSVFIFLIIHFGIKGLIFPEFNATTYNFEYTYFYLPILIIISLMPPSILLVRKIKSFFV